MKTPRKNATRPMTRPKGYRTIVVEDEMWFWTRGGSGIVARKAATRERFEADWQTVERFQRECGPGTWNEYGECSTIEPRHVAGWLKDITRWRTITA